MKPSTFQKQLKKDPSIDVKEIISVSFTAEGKRIIGPVKIEKNNEFVCKIQIYIKTIPSSHCGLPV